MNLDNDLDAAITVVGKIEEEQYLFRIEAEAATTEGTRTPTHASVSGGRTPARFHVNPMWPGRVGQVT